MKKEKEYSWKDVVFSIGGKEIDATVKSLIYPDGPQGNAKPPVLKKSYSVDLSLTGFEIEELSKYINLNALTPGIFEYYFNKKGVYYFRNKSQKFGYIPDLGGEIQKTFIEILKLKGYGLKVNFSIKKE